MQVPLVQLPNLLLFLLLLLLLGRILLVLAIQLHYQQGNAHLWGWWTRVRCKVSARECTAARLASITGKIGTVTCKAARKLGVDY